MGRVIEMIKTPFIGILIVAFAVLVWLHIIRDDEEDEGWPS